MKHFFHFLLFLPLSLAAQDYDCAAPDRLCPLDPGKADPVFVAYWEKLNAAVEAKSWSELLPLLDHDIQFSFGADAGIDQFAAEWKIHEGYSWESRLWSELAKTIAHGYRTSGSQSEYIAPYYFYDWPDDFHHEAGYRLIVGDHVNLRNRPSLQGEKVGQLHYQLVYVEEESEPLPSLTLGEETYPWVFVESPGGKGKGYVWGKFVADYEPYGYRAGFKKRNGTYKMTFFLAGD